MFAPLAKLNTVKKFISLAAHFHWPLHIYDVNNAFLHGDLEEVIYMEPPLGFRESYTHHKQYVVTVLLVYTDDIIITGNDSEEIKALSTNLSQRFDVKSLGKLKYFLGIEVYIFDLLQEKSKVNFKPVDTPLEANVKLGLGKDSPSMDRGWYLHLIEKLVYLNSLWDY
ncbi:unnamed protein product [Spirodela intermedia]|uniref:Reverse transcriptase Ty1/copia-type domain-containing protein n=2 Tax=Spirodela intermedia TaxID=51605 RepID=A0A7I8KX75_SPIIN|nr:unnamed protein product [Spirodela intermedia]CAA6664916.1 unnamed protein product [Spirodela intermedia]CAA7401554.1 unnamed protein product [Spirodela intermedia]